MKNISDEQEILNSKSHYELVEKTETCVVVISEQNEIDSLKTWINAQRRKNIRRKIVERDLEKKFKGDKNPFDLQLFVAVWITGFLMCRVYQRQFTR